jgi:gas vesicle protein
VPTPPGESDVETDWQQVAIFAVGALLGAAVGAGAALLLAPQTGEDARQGLARRGRRLRARTANAWEDLREELEFAARRGRRKIGRTLRHRRRRRDREREDALAD